MSTERDLTINVLINNSAVGSQLSRTEAQVKRFAKNSENGFKNMNKAGKEAKNILSGNFELLGGLVAGHEIIEAAKRTMEFDKTLLDMKQNAGATAEEMLRLKQAVYDTGVKSGVSMENLTGMTEGFIEEAHDMPFVTQNLDKLSMAFQAVGGDAKVFGKVTGTLRREMKMSGDEIFSMIDNLYTKGQSEHTEKNMQQLLPQMPELVEAAKTYYQGSADGKKISNLLLMSMAGVDPSIAMKMLSKNLTPAVKKMMKAMNVSLIDKNGAKRDVLDVLRDMITVTKKKGGDIESVLSAVFGVKSSIGLTKLKNDFEEIERMSKTVASGGLAKAAAEQGATAASGFERLNTALAEISDKAMSPILEQIAKVLSGMSAGDIKEIATTISSLGQAVGLLVIGLGKFLDIYGKIVTAGAEWIFHSSNENQEVSVQEVIRGAKIKSEQAKSTLARTSKEETRRRFEALSAADKKSVMDEVSAKTAGTMGDPLALKKALDARDARIQVTSNNTIVLPDGTIVGKQSNTQTIDTRGGQGAAASQAVGKK